MKLKAISMAALLFLGSNVMAQKKDTSAKQIVESGSKAEKEIKKEIQKDQLKKAPVLLNVPSAANHQNTTSAASKKKKACSRKPSGKS